MFFFNVVISMSHHRGMCYEQFKTSNIKIHGAVCSESYDKAPKMTL